MADFEYVTWTDGTPTTSDRLAKMSENDQHLKDLLDTLPKGILGWAESSDDKNVSVGMSPLRLTNMRLDIDHEENRLIRVGFRSKGVKGQRDLTAMLAISVDDSIVATSIMGGRKNVPSGPFEVFYIWSPPAGTVKYEIVGSNLNGTDKYAVFRASATSPRQMWVEDLGAYIAPDPGAGGA